MIFSDEIITWISVSERQLSSCLWKSGDVSGECLSGRLEHQPMEDRGLKRRLPEMRMALEETLQPLLTKWMILNKLSKAIVESYRGSLELFRIEIRVKRYAGITVSPFGPWTKVEYK